MIIHNRANPCSKAKLPRHSKSQVKSLTDEQINAFLEIVDDDEYFGPLIMMIVFTGLREAEAIGLTWDSIDFKNGIIKVTKQLQKRPNKDRGFTFSTLKNDKTRSIKPASFVMKLLQDQAVKQMEAKSKALDQWRGWLTEKERKMACVFTNEFGQHLHPQTVYKRRQDAGIH